jgi:hypothetical protein
MRLVRAVYGFVLEIFSFIPQRALCAADMGGPSASGAPVTEPLPYGCVGTFEEAEAQRVQALARGAIRAEVCHLAAIPELRRDFPAVGVAEAAILSDGTSEERAALAWAQASYWARGGRTLESVVECLTSDLEEGTSNGAGSEAAGFLAALERRLEAAPTESRVVVPARAECWEVSTTFPEADGPDTSGYAHGEDFEGGSW